MNISLELYKVFYFVAKNKSITRAANELLISQPAISKSIKTLEDQINTQLFIRKREGVELTDTAEKIYSKIKDAMDLIDSAEDDIKSITNLEEGNINIGASSVIIHEFLMPFIKEFHKRYPKIHIKIYTDQTSILVKKAKLGIIDILFINMPFTIPEEFESQKLMNLHDCFVATDSFSNLKNKDLNIKDLENLPLLVLNKGSAQRTALDDFCAKNNITIHPEMELGGTPLIKEFTQAGIGIGILTREYIQKELESKELFELNLNLPFQEKYLGMAYEKDKQYNSIVNAFIQIVNKKRDI